MWPFRRTPFTLIEPGQDPSDVQVSKPSIQWWHIAIVGAVVILIVWPMLNKPKQAEAGMVTETLPPASITVTSTPTMTSTSTKTGTATKTATPKIVNQLITVEVTRIVKETVVVPRSVEITRQVQVPVEVTRIALVTVEVTREPIFTIDPPKEWPTQPTQTPWVILITQIVEVTSTPTETPTVTPTVTSTLAVDQLPTITETPTPTAP